MSRSGRRAARAIYASISKLWGRFAARSRHKAAPTRIASASTAVVTVLVMVTLVQGTLMAALPITAPFPVTPPLPVPPGLLAPPLLTAPVASVVMPAIVVVRQQRGRLCIGHAGHPRPGVAGRLQWRLNGRCRRHRCFHLSCRCRAHRREREQAEQHQPCDMYFHERSQPLITIEPSGQQVWGEPCLACRYLSVPHT